MSTRAIYGILNQDGSVIGTHCHFDGYPSGLGSTLETYYNTDELVRELLSHGEASSIGETIDQCNFYADRKGEDPDELVAIKFESQRDFLNYDWDYPEYAYLFVNGKWMVYDEDDDDFTIGIITAIALEES